MTTLFDSGGTMSLIHEHIDVFTNETKRLHNIQQDLLPISILVPKYIQNVPNHKVMTALFDSGGTISLIHEIGRAHV